MEAKLIFLTSDVEKAWLFYSAIGIQWLAGEDSITDPTELQNTANPQGLPELWGKFGEVEIIFFSAASAAKQPSKTLITLLLNIDDDKTVATAIQKLKSLGLFFPDAEFDPRYNKITILDPDGRKIDLCGPTVFRL